MKAKILLCLFLISLIFGCKSKSKYETTMEMLTNLSIDEKLEREIEIIDNFVNKVKSAGNDKSMILEAMQEADERKYYKGQIDIYEYDHLFGDLSGDTMDTKTIELLEIRRQKRENYLDTKIAILKTYQFDEEVRKALDAMP